LYSVAMKVLNLTCGHTLAVLARNHRKTNDRYVLLKRNPIYYTWTTSRTKRNQWQYWILAAVSRCCSWCTAWNRYGRNFSCFVARWALVTDKHFLCPEILLPFGVGWPPFVDDFAGHPVLPTHLPDRILNFVGGSYAHVHTLPHPKWHKTKYFMAMNKQREMRFI
jgi:hypothetical protein